jgi:hypothetical protein
LLGGEDVLEQVVGLLGVRHGEDPELDGHGLRPYRAGRTGSPRIPRRGALA